MSTDHELLKRAAKAAGITLIRWNETYACYETSGGLWNPYLNDGDALRLAVKVLNSPHGGRAFENQVTAMFAVGKLPTDPCAATRLAILRAAAEIEPQ